MVLGDSRQRWWLVPGEIGGYLQSRRSGVALVFEYDDETLWSFRLTGPDGDDSAQIIWDHQAEGLVTVPDPWLPELATSLVDALQAMARPGSSWKLSPREQLVLDLLARGLRKEKYASGRRARATLNIDEPELLSIMNRSFHAT